ncbi:Txe/YoeB family addiction module toxin [Flavobacterium agrisoli]|uniref:Putative mRNA interferase YoeB n=1 Tax=Flavobacterium agrisoli TaxID=2793066 RepID=A0A934PLY6_9FLAO|nr:Txe/YoeB family addiction module toxin [Flavobacterium agrisoli]MBK0369744.1 Txe/YoeB family addiction module toxin [Flavobacterium agrisoli]
MQIIFTPKAKKDFDFWVKSGNKNILKRINSLIDDILLHPFHGIGKPEQLKHKLSGVWSRRIDKEHRLVYEIKDENTIEILNILSLKGHY